MRISLESRTEITAWAELFRIFAFDLCSSVWNLLAIPQNMRKNPKNLRDISKFFFSADRSIPLDHDLSSESEATGYLEGSRMVALGHLYSCFGKLTAYYGESAAEELYKFGVLHFVGEPSRFWHYWDLVFSRLRNDSTWVAELLGNRFQDQLVRILNTRFEQLTLKQRELAVEWQAICDTYSSSLEFQRERLYEILGYDTRDPEFSNVEGFESQCDELGWVFDFDSMIEGEHAVAVWRDLNKTFEDNVRNDFFDLVLPQIAEIDQDAGQVINRLRNSYLNL